MKPGTPEDAQAREALAVQRAQGGDTDAFGELVTMHQATMHQAAAFRVRTSCWVARRMPKTRRRRGSSGPISRSGGFATGSRSGRGSCRSSATRRGTGGGRAVAARGCWSESSPRFRGGVASAPEPAAILGETQAEVRNALSALDEGERLVITCRYLLELSEAETAAALGIPAGTVKSRLHRGVRRLRDRLEPVTVPVGTGE